MDLFWLGIVIFISGFVFRFIYVRKYKSIYSESIQEYKDKHKMSRYRICAYIGIFISIIGLIINAIGLIGS